MSYTFYWDTPLNIAGYYIMSRLCCIYFNIPVQNNNVPSQNLAPVLVLSRELLYVKYPNVCLQRFIPTPSCTVAGSA